MAGISQVPRGHHGQNTKLQETSRLRKTKNLQQDECTQSTELTIGSQRKYFKEHLHSNCTINIGVRYSYLRNDGCKQHSQVTDRPESRNASYSGSTTRHKCQDDETRTSDVTRRTSSKADESQLYRRIRGNVHHLLHTTIGRRQRNGWTAEIQECHRLVSRPLEDPRQLEIDNSAPWEQLPYHCRIDWTKEGTEVLKQRSLAYIRSQPDNTYYTDGSGDGTRVAAAVVHKTEEMIIRLNDSASVLDAKMTAIQLALEDASGTRDKITIHTDSLTAATTLSKRKLHLDTITSAIRDAASRLTQMPTINWIPAHTGIPGNEKADQAAKRGLRLDRIHTTVDASTFIDQTRMKDQMERHCTEQAYSDASQQTKDHRRLHQTVSSRKKLMSMPRRVQRSIRRLKMRCLTYSQVTPR